MESVETTTRSNASVQRAARDRKSTRLNSSHEWISYAVFCLKKKKKQRIREKSAPTTETGPPCRSTASALHDSQSEVTCRRRHTLPDETYDVPSAIAVIRNHA